MEFLLIANTGINVIRHNFLCYINGEEWNAVILTETEVVLMSRHKHKSLKIYYLSMDSYLFEAISSNRNVSKFYSWHWVDATRLPLCHLQKAPVVHLYGLCVCACTARMLYTQIGKTVCICCSSDFSLSSVLCCYSTFKMILSNDYWIIICSFSFR